MRCHIVEAADTLEALTVTLYKLDAPTPTLLQRSRHIGYQSVTQGVVLGVSAFAVIFLFLSAASFTTEKCLYDCRASRLQNKVARTETRIH